MSNLKTPHDISFLDSAQNCTNLELSNIYALGIVIAFLPKRGGTHDEKIDIINSHEFIGGFSDDPERTS